jgi:hypothetical protein
MNVLCNNDYIKFINIYLYIFIYINKLFMLFDINFNFNFKFIIIKRIYFFHYFSFYQFYPSLIFFLIILKNFILTKPNILY